MRTLITAAALTIFASIGGVASASAANDGPHTNPAPVSAQQAASCANTTLTRSAESGGTLAFIDAGADNVVAYVCIESTEFNGGEGGPFSTNGLVANGCYAIDGVGTDVVAVFREDPAIAPGCDPMTSISAAIRPRLDLDCSGTVAAPDALLLLQIIAGTAETSPACPVAISPGERNINTVLRIRRIAAGLPARS